MIWYFIESQGARITPKEFSGETRDYLICEKGSREGKITAFRSYFPSWESAQKALIERIRNDIFHLNNALDDLQEDLAKAKSLQLP